MILARIGDKNQNNLVNMAEIQCIIFKQNNVKPYKIYKNYIELSMFFS